MTFDKKVKAFQKVSNLYIVDISAKNKYGWGPPSSTFTFYNKGVGKSHFIYEIFYLYENRDEEKQENFHFSPRLLDTTDQVQGAQSGKRSEKGNFQFSTRRATKYLSKFSTRRKTFLFAPSLVVKAKGYVSKIFHLRFHTG